MSRCLQAVGLAALLGFGVAGGAQTVSSTKGKKVTISITVKARAGGEYLPAKVAAGVLGAQAIAKAPRSATVMTRAVLNAQQARLLSDVAANDASVNDDYVPVGYYGVYEIRGYPIDLATGLAINGMTIAGEQDVPLENKEQVNFLHGLTGVESGVAAGAGAIDYITKRPADIGAIDLASDGFGTAYLAGDFGHLFGRRQQFGVRVNVAEERLETYMRGTGGWRSMGALALDWRLSPRATLEGDFEAQRKIERDGSGYQLLGGTTLPDLHRLSPATMLGEQSWAPPNTYDTFNTSVRLNLALTANWAASAAASLSQSLIQDNVIYAYGCGYEAACAQSPAYFFAPDGSYDIYDYRNPDERRVDAEAESMASGMVRTGPVTQFVTAGGELFVRTVRMPGFVSRSSPVSPDGVVQDGPVYSYLGSENIYQPIVPYPIETPVESAGPERLWQDSRQASLVVQDRIAMPGGVQLIAGGRYDALRDHNFSAWASCASASDLDAATAPVANPCAPVFTDRPVWLPKYALTWSPAKNLMLYTSYAATLSLGPQAPWWAANGSQFLAPYFTRQFEVGAKYQATQRLLLSADVFHMQAPFFYPRVTGDAAGDVYFEQQGRETHNGLEVNVQGRAAGWLRLLTSTAVTSAVAHDTGTPEFDGQQVINVPRFRTTAFAEVSLGRLLAGLELLPGWSYTSAKAALRDDAVTVPGYALVNLGVSYTPGGESRATFRVWVANLANKKYWADTGTNYGDSFLWLGAPRWIRASVHYNF